MKNLNKILVLILVLMTFMSMPVFAIDIPITPASKGHMEELFKRVEIEVEGIREDSATNNVITVVPKEGNSKDGDTIELLKYNSDKGILTFSAEGFKKANQKKAENIMKVFIKELKDSSLPLDVQQEIMNQIQESDNDVAAIMIPLIFDESKADLFTAYKWLYPFLQILRVVFGIGAVLIVLLLIGSTIMDMVYIGLPVWREKEADKGKKNPFGVSYEAIKTVTEIEKSLGDGGYQNAYLLYLKRRALTYVVFAICLLYLIVGELGGLISWLLSLASGVVG